MRNNKMNAKQTFMRKLERIFPKYVLETHKKEIEQAFTETMQEIIKEIDKLIIELDDYKPNKEYWVWLGQNNGLKQAKRILK